MVPVCGVVEFGEVELGEVVLVPAELPLMPLELAAPLIPVVPLCGLMPLLVPTLR